MGFSVNSNASNRSAPSNLNLRAWDCTAKKTASIAAKVMLICAGALACCILITQYPNSYPAFITSFSVLSAASFLVFVIAIYRHCKPHAPVKPGQKMRKNDAPRNPQRAQQQQASPAKMRSLPVAPPDKDE